MILEYRDKLNHIKQNISISEDMIKDFFVYKKIPLNLISFCDKTVFENDYEFANWLNDVFSNKCKKEISDFELSVFKNLIQIFIKNRLWNNVDNIKKELINLKYTMKSKYNIDFIKIYNDFMTNFYDDSPIGNLEKKYKFKAKKWGVDYEICS